MEIKDSLNDNRNIQDYIHLINDIKAISDPAELVVISKAFLTGSPHVDSAVKTIVVFINTFLPMHRVLAGKEVTPQSIEKMFISESVVLNLGDSWYRSLMPIIEPVMISCRTSLTQAHCIQARPDNLKTDADVEVIRNLRLMSWDFIPWIIYLATQNENKFLASKEVFTRVLSVSLDTMLEG